jgi:hypothetical protein
MTTLGLPSQSVPQPARNAAANALANERSAGNQHDAQDGSVFDALLGALEDAQAQIPRVAAPSSGNASTGSTLPAQSTAEALPAASWRSISAVHNLGSGVLVALDKRVNSSGAQEDEPASPETPKAKTSNSADMSALTNIGWASLILSATGAPQLTAAGSAAASHLAAANPALARPLGDKGVGATAQAAPPSSPALVAMPSDAKVTTSMQAVALNAGPSPVDVKVTRSITYLGLDPTARGVSSGQGLSMLCR